MSAKFRPNKAVFWRFAVAHDDRIDDLARAVAIAADDAPSSTLDAAALAHAFGVTEREIYQAVDRLYERKYCTLRGDGTLYLRYVNSKIERRARGIARHLGIELPRV